MFLNLPLTLFARNVFLHEAFVRVVTPTRVHFAETPTRFFEQKEGLTRRGNRRAIMSLLLPPIRAETRVVHSGWQGRLNSRVITR